MILSRGRCFDNNSCLQNGTHAKVFYQDESKESGSGPWLIWISTTSAKGKKSQIALSGISNHTSGWDLVMDADAQGKRACRYHHNSMLRHLTQDQGVPQWPGRYTFRYPHEVYQWRLQMTPDIYSKNAQNKMRWCVQITVTRATKKTKACPQQMTRVSRVSPRRSWTTERICILENVNSFNLENLNSECIYLWASHESTQC